MGRWVVRARGAYSSLSGQRSAAGLGARIVAGFAESVYRTGPHGNKMEAMAEIQKALIYLLLASASALAAVDFDRDIRPISVGQLLRLPRPGCDETHGESASGYGGWRRVYPQHCGGREIGREPSVRARIRYGQPSACRPAYSGRTLTAAADRALKQWIDQGAKWQSHWAFVAPQRPDLPAVAETAWVRNPIDSFILARLEKEGLKHSPEAGKATLLRRVTYDLTGLPPTLAELNSFSRTNRPTLMKSAWMLCCNRPVTASAWRMQWLDLARYADTHGYHIDSQREMWHWRDWVINAFNANMPYDEFTIEQLAGDLLPNATIEQKLASGFNRNHMINFEGGAIPEEYQVEYVVDRLEATSTTWMGLTMGCARCHDHKYDPIPQRDFYRFFAFFNNVSEKGWMAAPATPSPICSCPQPAQKARQEELKAAIAAHEKSSARRDASPNSRPIGKRRELAAFQSLGREGLLAHYEFDGSLTDTSGHYQYGRVVKGDLTYCQRGGGPRGRFRRPNARRLRPRAGLRTASAVRGRLLAEGEREAEGPRVPAGRL